MHCFGVKVLLFTIFSAVLNYYHVKSDSCPKTSTALKPHNSTTSTAEEKCLYQCVDKKLFYECMLNCSKSWIFTVGGSTCLDSSENSSRVACKPRDIEVYEVRKRLDSGEIAGFIYLKWKPCIGGIEKLRGFQIVVTTPDPTPTCYVNQLTHVLNDTVFNQNKQFGFIIGRPLKYSTEYRVYLVAYPFVTSLPFPCIFIESSTCEELNGERSCFCYCDNLPAPIVTVTGYDVDVTFPAAKDCFSPMSYSVRFRVKGENADCDSVKSKYVSISHSNNNQSIITHRFDNIYDSNNYIFNIEVKVEYAQDCGFPTIKNTTFKVEAWKPPQPNVTIHRLGHVTIYFHVSSAYNITRFNVSLSRYADDETNKDDAILSFRILHINSAKDGILSADYYRLSNGVYSAEIREVRPNSTFCNTPEWGPSNNFIVETEVDMLILAVILPFTVMVFLILLLFYCVRKGVVQQGCDVYRKIQNSTPNVPVPTHPPSQRKKVLLIWQADNRSEELERAQKHVIKRFVIFLSHVCGIDVTVDLYEQINLSRKYSAWIDEARKDVDWIVFVCPHFDYSNQNQVKTGNFSLAFRYLETHAFDRSNFITVVFEHANLDLTDDTKALRRLTTGTYHLMDEIDGFYFHTQGFTKSWYFVWLLHRYISFRGYVKISEGQELDMALKDMKAKIKQFKPPLTIQDIDGPNAGYASDNDQSSIPIDACSITFSVHSFAYPTDTSIFPCKERAYCESMASLVGNENEAKDAIRNLNQQSSLEEPHSHYPYQNSADRSEEERERMYLPSRVFYSVDESWLHHCHVFGEECVRCDDDVISSLRLSSESNDETLPKSPGVHESVNVELNGENNSINTQIDTNGDSGIFPFSGDLDHSTNL